MRWALLDGSFRVMKEVARHLLRRPVAGVAMAARTEAGEWVLIRRGDTGGWALPGGTLEWGETYRTAVDRELLEETGCRVLRLGRIAAFSDPERDPRFHAVTILVEVTVEPPSRPPENPVEILEVRLFRDEELPATLSHGMEAMLAIARRGESYWE